MKYNTISFSWWRRTMLRVSGVTLLGACVLGAEVENGVEEMMDLRSQADALSTRETLNELLYEALYDVMDEEYAVAIPKLERVLLENPTAMPAWQSLGWSYWNLGRRADAIRLWNELLVLNPEAVQAYNLLGMAAAAEDDLDTAADRYRQGLQIDPRQFHPRLALARINRWRGHLDESIAVLKPLLAEDPDRLDVRLELARALLQNWHFEEAEPHWRVLLRFGPDNIEYQMAMASVSLHQNRVDEAVTLAENILEKEPDHIGALTLLADAREYGGHPRQAIPILERLIELAQQDKALLHHMRTRLVRLQVRLHRREPDQQPLQRAIQIAEDMAKADPFNVDTRLLLGELNSMEHRFDEAEKHLLYVLERMNPHNQRARRSLFEVYIGARNHAKAREQLDFIRAFNPDDPYLHVRIARYESGRGNFHKAYEALDELERRGRAGAVKVLLYHAISPSDWTSTPSKRRLYEQLNALREAGYRFITPEELPAHFEQVSRRPASSDDFTIDKVVMVTFDDALRSSMRYGTEVAQALGVRFAQFVITGFTEREDPFVSTWDELREWQKTGVWSFHSQLYLAEQRVPIDARGHLGLPLANRIWLSGHGRNETRAEYEARLQHDYRHSRALLRQHLGRVDGGRAVAYPLGELGQETASNVDHAIRYNLATAAQHYDMGFRQTPFGHAVAGDHPFLYQRHELHRSAEGPEMLAQVMENHPVLLAERMRLEFATMQGRPRLAQRALNNLRKAGYPAESMDRAETYFRERIATRFATPDAAERARPGMLDLGFDDPYAAVGTRYFRDNLDRQNWFQHVRAGFQLTPRVTLEGRAGAGQLRQTTRPLPIEGQPQPREEVNVDEQQLGVRGAGVLSNQLMVSAEGRQRRFSGDADWNPFTYAIDAFWRPHVLLDTHFRFENDAVESAHSVREQLQYDLLSAHGMYHALDWMDLWASGMRYAFSDSNERTHLTLAAQWRVYEPWGAYVGLRYGYVNADKNSQDYWTPYRLHRYYVEALLRNNHRRVFYNIGARAGLGKQSVRPEALAAYEETVERAQRLRFEPGAPPSTDWQTLLGLFASTRIRVGPHWNLNAEVSYNRLPEYREWSLNASATYQF